VVTTSPRRKWREFEEIVAGIQRALTPHCSVTTDERIVGMKSRVPRQIDIAVRCDGALTIFDCKDYRKRIDVKKVEEFMGLAEDVSANAAILVSAHGFTKAALNRGKAAGIGLYTILDTDAHDWRTEMTLPALEDCRVVSRWRWRVASSVAGQLALLEDATIYNDASQPCGTLLEKLNTKVAADVTLQEAGSHEEIDLFVGYARTDSGLLVPIDVQADIDVRQDLFLWDIRVTHIKGFRDAVTGAIHTRGFVLDWIAADSAASGARLISSMERLAVRPIVQFVTLQTSTRVASPDRQGLLQ
jgi:hypothetical protein